MTFPIDRVAADEFETMYADLERAFGEDADAESTAHERRSFELDRSLAARDGRSIVGTTGAYTFRMRVPGATVPVAGVTFVAVQPTYRRRGVMTALMDAQLAELHADGREATAALWASESRLYGRFGYGIASQQATVRIPRAGGALRADLPSDQGVRLELCEPADLGPRLAPAYDYELSRRPGMTGRDDLWWGQRLADVGRPKGTSKLLAVLAHGPDGDSGYALYAVRRTSVFTPESDQTVALRELNATSAATRVALWRYLLGLSLMDNTHAWSLPVDDPIVAMLADPRRAEVSVTDNLHVRLVDVPRALGERRYRSPVDAVLEVSDPRCPWNSGCWRLTGDTDGAECTASTADPDVTLPVEALGAAYLGGPSLAWLAHAGRIEVHRPEALSPLSAGFGSDLAPHCPMVF